MTSGKTQRVIVPFALVDTGLRWHVRAYDRKRNGFRDFLQRWGVDCSPDHHLTDEPYRLWLADSLTLYGVESAALAPGYQPPQA